MFFFLRRLGEEFPRYEEASQNGTELKMIISLFLCLNLSRPQNNQKA